MNTNPRTINPYVDEEERAWLEKSLHFPAPNDPWHAKIFFFAFVVPFYAVATVALSPVIIAAYIIIACAKKGAAE